MASVTFKRGTKAEIENTQIQDGQLLMETDQLNNNKIYLDLPNGTRVPVGGSGAWVGTQEEFELAVEEGKIADGTQVIITDDYESGITASMTLYSNAQSGLVATNVQSAIDELDSTIDTLNSNFSEFKKIYSVEIECGSIQINAKSFTIVNIGNKLYGKKIINIEPIPTAVDIDGYISALCTANHNWIMVFNAYSETRSYNSISFKVTYTL